MDEYTEPYVSDCRRHPHGSRVTAGVEPRAAAASSDANAAGRARGRGRVHQLPARGWYPASRGAMKHARIVVTHYGGPDALQVVEEEAPEPRPGEVRLRVLAAGVSLPDVRAREGVHPETPRPPFTPGWLVTSNSSRHAD